MALLTKKDIISVKDLKTETVNIPEWGGEVIVRGLTAKERDDFENDVFGKVEEEGKITGSFRAKLAVRCCVDEKGNPLFNPADYIALEKKSGKAVQRIFRVAQKLSGMTHKDIEDLAKN